MAEYSWLRIKSGLILQNYRRSTGQMLELGDGGRLEIKDQTGTGPAVMRDGADIFPNTLAIGTDEPGIDVGGTGFDITGNVFEVENTGGQAHIIIDGDIPVLTLVDRAGADDDDKIMTYIVDGGLAYFSSVTHTGAPRVAQIISMDMGSGDVSMSNDLTIGEYLYIDDGRIYLENITFGGAGYELFTWFDGSDIYMGAFLDIASDIHIYAGTGDIIYLEDIVGTIAHFSVSFIRMYSDVRISATKDLDCNTYGAYFKPRRVAQSATPTPDDYELLIHHDTDDDTHYLVYRDPNVGAGTTYQVQIT